MKNLILICPTISQPRFHKRADQLDDIFHLEIFAFSRGLYEMNTFPKKFSPIQLGKIKDKFYLKRIFKLIRAIFIIRKHVIKYDKKETLFYAFSLDTLIIGWLCGIKTGFYEVGDIRFDRNKKTIFSRLENLFARNLKAVVVTSPKFVDEIKKSGSRLKNIPYILIENKMPEGLSRPQLDIKLKKNNEKIKIGVIGFLRYEAPLKKILSFVLNHSEIYELHCWGDGPCRKLFENHSCQSINYYGSFKNPDSLEDIYGNIDLNYVVYGGDIKSEIGVRLAIPNKLYESIFYGIPLLCRSETEIGAVAESMGVGITIQESEFEHDLLAISFSQIRKMQKKCYEIKSGDIVDKGRSKLKKAISKLGLI